MSRISASLGGASCRSLKRYRGRCRRWRDRSSSDLTCVHSHRRRGIATIRSPPHNTVMPSPRLILFVVAVLVSTVGGIATVLAQSSPEPAKASPAVVKSAPMADIVFYLARGDADACGRGCNEWIVAEGKIDPGAAQRFRRLLAKLGHRRLPVFFHSPGGSVTGSIELGRLIHDQKLEVSVAHTISLGCDLDKPLEKPCEALKRSGQELLSEFDPTLAMCNSACVFALAGGTVRSRSAGGEARYSRRRARSRENDVTRRPRRGKADGPCAHPGIWA